MDLQHQCVKLELQCPGHFAMAPSVKCSGKIKLIFLCIQSVVKYIISISVPIKNMDSQKTIRKNYHDFYYCVAYADFSNKPETRFSEILDLMNKLQLPFSYFTLYPDLI